MLLRMNFVFLKRKQFMNLLKDTNICHKCIYTFKLEKLNSCYQCTD